MNENFQELLLIEISHLFEPLLLAAESEEARHRLFEELGWDVSAITNFPIADLQTCLNELAAAYTQVETWVETPPTALNQLLQSLDTVRRLVLIIQKLHQILDKPGVVKPAGFEKLAEDLIEFLAVDYLARRSPSTYAIARLLTIITQNGAPPSEIVIDPTTKVVLRYPTSRPKVHLDRIPKLLEDPLALLEAEYMPNGLATYADAQNAAKKLFPPLITLLELCGIRAMYGLNPTYGISLGSGGDEIAQLSMGFMIALEPDPAFADTGFGATLAFSPTDRGDLGLVISPFGQFSFTQTFQSWLIHLLLEGGLGGFAIHPRHGLRLPDTAQEGHVTFAIQLSKLTNGAGPAFLIGSTQDTRLEIGQFAITAETTLGLNQQEYGVLFEVGSAAFVVSAGDGDGFLQKILPKDGIRLDFDLAIGWSNKKGLYFKGGAGLEATLPVNIDLFGVIKIDSVYLALEAKEDSKTKESAIRAAAATTVQVKLGPVSATVERFGLQATLSFPEKGGNLGVANLDLGFKPPKGAGFSIDTGVVVGEGYLFFDTDKEQYGGIIHLEIAQFLNVTATGLITTKMPDGSPGFSLLVLIAVEFAPPIQLGYGFTLNGVGGLLGVNRIAVVEAIRSGLRAGTLGSILFPRDPIANAPKIISDLTSVFPPAPDRFVFGPMAILGWGAKSLIQLHIALVLELPAPVRLLILGRLRVLLPDEKAPVVRLQLDSLGVIDFGNGDISLDAVLYDSEIKGFAITGAMALRANVGTKPNFLLSVGGFHPAFQPPPNFPVVERVAISLATGDNPRFRLATYFALTTNTVQFGAWLELYATAGPFVLEGRFGFDTLIQFNPFGLTASMEAMLAVKFEGNVVLAIGLALTMTGPTPWRFWGKATIRFLFFEATANFDQTIGVEEAPSLPPSEPIRPLLVEALKEPRNWGTQLGVGQHPLVVLREQKAQKVTTSGDHPAKPEQMVHPLADLHVTQQVVPLEVVITRFGSTTPEPNMPDGTTKFTLTAESPSGALRVDPNNPVKDLFSPAQFKTMSDAEKLAAPAFEPYKSGLRFVVSGFVCGTPVPEEEMQYEEDPPVVASPSDQSMVAMPQTVSYVLASHFVERMAPLGAVGRATLYHSGRAQFQEDLLKPGALADLQERKATKEIGVEPRRYKVVTFEKVGGTREVEQVSGKHYAEALELLDEGRHELPRQQAFRIVPDLVEVSRER